MNQRAGQSRKAVLFGVLIGVLLSAAVATVLAALLTMDVTGKKGSGLGKQFQYDIKAQGQIDPALIGYEQVHVFESGFERPMSLAVGQDGRVYVAGDRAVRRFDNKGQLTQEVTLTAEAWCVAVDDAGLLYVALQDHVEVFSGSGEQKATWAGLGDKAVLTSITLAGDDVFVADAGQRLIWRYNLSGEVIGRIAEKDIERNINALVVPSPYLDVAMGADGLLRVTDPGRRQIKAFTRKGDMEFAWGTYGNAIEAFCGCCNPANFALLPDEQGFVTCEKGLTRVKIYDIEGRFVTVVAGPEQFAEHARAVSISATQIERWALDVAADAAGRVLVLDPVTAKVHVFVSLQNKNNH